MIQGFGAVRIAVLMIAVIALTACSGAEQAFVPGSPGSKEIVERKALEQLPSERKVQSVSTVEEWGRMTVGGVRQRPEVVGYNVWIRLEGCTGYYLSRFNRFGRLMTVSDTTRCSD